MEQQISTETEPHWKISKNYDYTDNHDARDWGWEFIRRNPAYIEESNAHLQGFREDKEWRELAIKFYCHFNVPLLALGATEELKELGITGSKGLDEQGHPIFDSEEFMNVKIACYKELGCNITDPEDYETFEMFIANCWPRWGIMNFQDHRAKHLTECNKLAIMSPFYPVFSRRTGTRNIKIEENACYARIDLTVPISLQLEYIKILAEKEQKIFREENPEYAVATESSSVTQFNKNLWKTYIRCLDAFTSGAKRQEAAAYFFPKAEQTSEKKWDAKLEQAKAMALSGFRGLMYESIKEKLKKEITKP